MFLLTVNVAIDTFADVDPAGTTTLGLAATAGFELTSVTGSPPAGAGPLSVTLAEDGTPPFTLFGFNVSADTADGDGLTVSSEVAVVPPEEAETVTGVAVATMNVLTVNVFVVLPFMIDTVAGTVAAPGVLLARLMMTPPAGAGAASVTVPVELVPPVTATGDNASVNAALATLNDRPTFGAAL